VARIAKHDSILNSFTDVTADRARAKALLAKLGPLIIKNTGYMVHLWNVPGYQNPDGMFGNLTPAITCTDGSYYTVPDSEYGYTRTICRV
jgi:hypothetical protein